MGPPPYIPYLPAIAPTHIYWSFFSLWGGDIQLPETHLRWELAALWVSRVCTRLLPETEIASSGKGGEGQKREGTFPRGLCGIGYSYPGPLSFYSNPEEVIRCYGCRGYECSQALAGCLGALWQTPASLKAQRERVERGERRQHPRK